MVKKSKPQAAAIPGQRVESPDDLLSIREAAEKDVLNVSVKTVQRLCKSGKLSYILITPTLWRIRRAAISYYLSKREIKATA